MPIEKTRYCGTWASSQYSSEGNMPSIPLKNNSLRQIVRTSIEGQYLRFHFSNYLGKSTMELRSVHLALAAEEGSGKIIKATDTQITFNGKTAIEIPAFGEVISDTIKFSAPALSELAVTIYFGDMPDTVTGHVGSRTFSYIQEGQNVSGESFSTKYKTAHWYVLSAIDVCERENSAKEAIVCFGDSITDGRGSTDDKQNRWTDIFAERLQANQETKNLAVLNHGIGGTCASTTGEERFIRDVLKQTNVKYLIILYGVNDILYMNIEADKLINTYKGFIEKAHSAGIKVIGGTILPFGKNNDWSEKKEETRLAVNKWIMTNPAQGGAFDGFIDFARAMKDPENNLYLNTAWNFENDGLHPNADGYKKMGEIIDLGLFKR